MPTTGSRSFTRRFIAVMATSLLASATLAVPAAAQDDEVVLPFTTAGAWEGAFVFDGHYAFDSAPDEDGAFEVGTSEVLGNTSISVDFVVAEDGTINGLMPTHLAWLKETAGAGPDGEPFHVVHDRVQIGELSLSGDAARIVASGVLEENFTTLSEGAVIEEVSGNEQHEVEWVFSSVVFDCATVSAPLVAASGDSIVRSALLPPEFTSGQTTFYNSLAAYLVMWPKQDASSELQSAAEDDLIQLADALREQPTPIATDLTDLIDAWHTMQAEIAALNECDTDGTFITSSLDQQWLAQMLQSALGTALENVDSYAAHQLVDLWDVGKAEAVLHSELRSEFYDAFSGMLDDAIKNGDTEAIEDIAAYAQDNGYTNLKARADTALG